MQTLAIDASELESTLLAELRSDHAGEYGAVAIYDGILAVTRSPDVKRFAVKHRAAEREHLAFFENFVPTRKRTRLLALWKVMAWSLGALPALFGPRAVYLTIEAVEAFVETHYQRQIAMLAGRPELDELRQVLERFCADEVMHGADARARYPSSTGLPARLWQSVVGAGSAAAVMLAKKF